MGDNSVTGASRFLSYILRHHPEAINLELDEYGWAHLPTLIRKAREEGRNLTREKIEEVVQSGSKKRFILSGDGMYIRAGYGHSIPVKLSSEPERPPETLYHGTARRNLESIQDNGLHPAGRSYVHLSAERGEAVSVGCRHGKPVVLQIAAAEMHEQGFSFHRTESEKDIWLVRKVPPQFIEPIQKM